MIESNPRYVRFVSEPVNSKTENLSLLFSALESELKNSQIPGVGLAAVQIGQLKRAAIIRTETAKLDMFNPVIESREGSIVHPEGCLSFPGVTRSIRRSQEVTIRNGDGRRFVFTGFEAIVAQHEIDHMDGITIVDQPRAAEKIGRNKLCPCGSKKKFKKCHIGKELELQQLLVRK